VLIENEGHWSILREWVVQSAQQYYVKAYEKQQIGMFKILYSGFANAHTQRVTKVASVKSFFVQQGLKFRLFDRSQTGIVPVGQSRMGQWDHGSSPFRRKRYQIA